MEQMTPEQAISIIQTNSCYECSFGCDSPLNCDSTKCDLIESVKLAISALGKQVPKKPKEEYYGQGKYWKSCPNCNDTLTDAKYCESCGQAIDWSE